MTPSQPDIRPAAGSHLESVAHIVTSRIVDHSVEEPETILPPARVNRVRPRSNVVSECAHRDALSDALTEVANIVARTLGPHGANTLIRDQAGAHFATKDGYTVLQRLTFVQETATMVLDHVRSVSRAMVRKVGDGSTSAVIMADALHTALSGMPTRERMPPGAVQTAIGIAAEMLAENAARVAVEPSDEQLLHVATVSANNDVTIGRLVAGAYEENGAGTNVTVVNSPGTETRVVRADGYRVLRGMVDMAFANLAGADGFSKTVCALDNPVVLIVGEVVSQQTFASVVAPTMNLCLGQQRPFVLVARDFAHGALDPVIQFVRKNPGAQILVVDHAAATRRGSARLGDLAAVLGATVLDGPALISNITAEEIARHFCGSAASVRSTASETVFLTAERSPLVRARADEITQQIERVDSANNAEEMADEIAELRARVSALLGSEVVIEAGGQTEQEKQTLAFLLDDAALAVRAALRSGVVEGMGMTGVRLLRLQGDSFKGQLALRVAERTRLSAEDCSELAAAVAEAFLSAYEQAAARVLDNSRVEDPVAVIRKCVDDDLAFNAVTRQFAYRHETVVLNPADTDAEIARGAASIVGLLVTSNQTVLTHTALGGGQD